MYITLPLWGRHCWPVVLGRQHPPGVPLSLPPLYRTYQIHTHSPTLAKIRRAHELHEGCFNYDQYNYRGKMKSKNKKLLTVDFIVLVLPVFNGCYIKGCPVWKNEPIWFLLKMRGKFFSCITHARTHKHTYVNTHACTHTCMHVHMHPDMHVCTHVPRHACTHAPIHASIHVYMHVYVHAHINFIHTNFSHTYKISNFLFILGHIYP